MPAIVFQNLRKAPQRRLIQHHRELHHHAQHQTNARLINQNGSSLPPSFESQEPGVSTGHEAMPATYLVYSITCGVRSIDCQNAEFQQKGMQQDKAVLLRWIADGRPYARVLQSGLHMPSSRTLDQPNIIINLACQSPITHNQISSLQEAHEAYALQSDCELKPTPYDHVRNVEFSSNLSVESTMNRSTVVIIGLTEEVGSM